MNNLNMSYLTVHEHLLRTLLTRIKPGQKLKLLDAGCGTLGLEKYLTEKLQGTNVEIEYFGYDKSSENKKNHYTQYEVPENFIKHLKTFKSNLDVGDLLVFHRKSVHTSTPNLSKKYSFAVVFRVWDFSKDLTMSGDLAVSPYLNVGNGRPNIEVDN